MTKRCLKLTDQFIRDNALLSEEEVNVTLDKVSTILEEEPKLIKIPKGRIYIVGDTHGNLPMTIHAFRHAFPDEESCHSRFDKIIFLGDFVDRGGYSVENVNFLMSLKIQYPEKIILIRGNHETGETSRRYGFYEKVLRRYGTETFTKYTSIFSKLPLAVLTWNNIFAVHGGIPEGLEHLSDLNGLDDEINPEDRIVFQILWNDPCSKDGWFYKNFRGRFSKKFGRAAFDHFIKTNNIDFVLRAHEPQKGGYKEYFGAHLVSLDSSDTRWRRKEYKVFIIEPSGEHRIAQVHDYKKLKMSKIFNP